MGAFTTATPEFGNVLHLCFAVDPWDRYTITVNETVVYQGSDAKEAIRIHRHYAPKLRYGVIARGSSA